ncbi:recombinase family protein [Robinsoniella peoriensis]
MQKIFQMALEGTTCFHIAKYLEAEKIPTPRAYLMDTEGKYVANERVKHPCSWATTTVHQILSNMSSFTKKARSAKAFAE